MKKIVLLMIIFCSISSGQEWNNTVTTAINESKIEKMDLFTNAYGNFLLVKRTNGTILCYTLNSSGQLVIFDEEAPNPTTFSTNGDFPAITGSSNTVYAFYKEGNNIKGRFSTNGGSTWSNLPDRSTTSNIANGIDAVYQDGLGGGVHLVWATEDDDPSFKTYYSRLNTDNEWVEFKDVTDHTNAPSGGRPSVTFSSNRVHVSFNEATESYNPGFVNTRDRNNGNWETPQSVSSDYSFSEKIITRGDYLYIIYDNENIPSVDLEYRVRSLSGSWSGGSTNIDGNIWYNSNITKTNDDRIHLVYTKVTSPEELLHSSFDGSWSETFELGEIAFGIDKGISSTSNDVFVVWKLDGNNYLRYRQYDAVPLSPQNLAITSYQIGEVHHPKLTWNRNSEPDVYFASNGYQIWRRTKPANGNWGSWDIIANISGILTSYIDDEIIIEGTGQVYVAEYRILAKDLSGNSSGYSNVVSIMFGQFNKINVSNETFDFQLAQNFPNPFNPITTISYSIKSQGMATLKVYDILGTEVASLVNEMKEAGNYSVNFNASNMPSGI